MPKSPESRPQSSPHPEDIPIPSDAIIIKFHNHGKTLEPQPLRAPVSGNRRGLRSLDGVITVAPHISPVGRRRRQR